MTTSNTTDTSNQDPQYEELVPGSSILQEGDEYLYSPTNTWHKQGGHTGERAIVGYRWRRKRLLPQESEHFL
jgi:hypothetical protein